MCAMVMTRTTYDDMSRRCSFLLFLRLFFYGCLRQVCIGSIKIAARSQFRTLSEKQALCIDGVTIDVLGRYINSTLAAMAYYVHR